MTDHPLEKPVQAFAFRGIEFELVERPDVIWVGCAGFAQNNADEPDIPAILRRYQELCSVEKRELVQPDWSAALSIDYTRSDRPCGMMFANETYTADQDPQFDTFTQPGGLWLRVRNDTAAAKALLGKDKAEPYEYFAGPQPPLEMAALEMGLLPHPDTRVQLEYHCHAEYGRPQPRNYAYIPVVRR